MSGVTEAGGPVTDREESDRRLLDRVIWRIMPLVALCMAIGTIDRSNIGFSKLSMAGSLGMSEATFGLGSSLFYIGYLLFEVPSALAAHRYGARTWFARIMVTWGLATLLLAFTASAPIFYILRFSLGMAEAGLYPGLLYYITIWFPRSQHARAMGFLTIGSALGNGVGALISGPLLDLDGALGLEGWQWIFLVTGLMPMIVVVLVLWLLRDRPAQARFLNDAEKRRLVALVEEDTRNLAQSGHFASAISDLRVLAHGVAYATILTALFGVIYWAPTLIKTFGVTGTENGMLVALPWAIDVVLLLLLPRRFRTRAQLLWAIVVLAGLGAGVAAAGIVVENNMLRYAALLVGIPCISLTLALYWTFPVRIFRGAHSAAAIGTISMLGNFGGLVAQNAMPAVAKAGGGASAALWVPCVCLVAILAGALVVLTRRTTDPGVRAGSV
jgi:MFS family permease